MCQCTVNCFTLLFGDVGIKGKYKYERICILRLKMLVYTVGITYVFALIGFQSIPIKIILAHVCRYFMGSIGILAKILVKRYYWTMLYVVSVVSAFLFKVGGYFSFTFIFCNMLTAYTSPLIVSAAVDLLTSFKEMKMNNVIGKIVVIVAFCRFGVYIIHRNGIF